MGYGIVKNNFINKSLITFFLLGLCGMLVEIIFTAILGCSTNHKYISFIGQTSLWSLLIYGSGSLIFSWINNKKWFYSLYVGFQFLISGFIFTMTELVWGIVLNLNPLLNLNIWHYNSTLNFLGQIDIWHSLCWIIFSGFFLWVKDTVIDFGVYRDETWVYNPLDNYKELFIFKNPIK